jgi:hypothetical protein
VAVFVDDPKVGKDPFFPDAVRPGANPSPEESPVAVPRTPILDQLEVEAIFGSSRTRISGEWFAAGESREIFLPDGTSVTIQVLTIQPNAVVISIPSLGKKEVLEVKGRKR